MQWYYANAGQRQGPVSEEEFQRLVAAGTVRDDTLVWREGLADWQPYAVVRGPAPGAVPAAPPPPPPAAPAELTLRVPIDGAAPPVIEETEVCAVSGKRFPKREMIQYEGRWVSAQHRDEFFQRLREGLALPGDKSMVAPHGYAGFWIRVVAKIIDAIIMGVVGALFGGAIGLAIGFSGALSSPAGVVLFQLALQTVNLAIGLTFDIYFLRKFDATPGKMAFGLKVVRANGEKLSIGRIVGRHFAPIASALILFVGFIMAAFDDEKRTLHDMICDTRVIKTR